MTSQLPCPYKLRALFDKVPSEAVICNEVKFTLVVYFMQHFLSLRFEGKTSKLGRLLLFLVFCLSIVR